ncbi:MAG: hypothetical protein LCH81_02430 [Bacteroidetes bacterium]|nr:hypothetical protein [Bacteroidota bacterium]
MKKYFVVPAFFAAAMLFTSCDQLVRAAIDDDTVCGENVNTGYRTVSDKAYEMMPVMNENTRFVYTNAAGEEMKLTLKEKREQKAVLNYKILCYNASYNITQYEYCETQMVDYVFENAEQGAKIYYSWYLDQKDEMIYNAFNTSIYMGTLTGGSNTWVADDLGNELPAIAGMGEWAREVGDTTILGRPFHNVTYYNWGINAGKGFYFEKGKGVIALQANNDILWVLDRVE